MTAAEGNPMQEGLTALESGDLDGAIRGFQRALRIVPDSFTAHHRLGETYRLKARDRDRSLLALAGREFGEALRTVPPDRTSHLQLITLGVALGRRDQLRAAYAGTLAKVPFAKECLAELAAARPAPAVAGGARDGAKIAVVAGLLVLGVWGGWRLTPIVLDRIGSAVGANARVAAPAFALDDLDGRTVRLSDFNGTSVVILDFWATWCGPCRAAMPALAALRQRHQARDLEVLSINLREDVGTIRAFLDREHHDLHVLLDRVGAVAGAYAVTGIPTLVVLDKRGGIRDRIVGYRPDLEDYLESVIKGLL